MVAWSLGYPCCSRLCESLWGEHVVHADASGPDDGIWNKFDINQVMRKRGKVPSAAVSDEGDASGNEQGLQQDVCEPAAH